MKFRPISWLIIVGTLAAAADDRSPEIEAGPASSLGLTAFTANGKIQPHTVPTSYYFEHGLTADYGSKTPERPLPPALRAFYRESWDQHLGGWQGGMNGKDLAHHATGGASNGFVRFAEPSGDDPNHIDGIGTLHLASYFYPGTHPNPERLRALFGGGDPDLRDARVKLHVRGNQWMPNGSECVWWTQSDNDVALQSSPDWRRANWAYTGFSLNDFLASGEWEKVEYRLNNNSHDWTYGGNNLAQKRPNYAYNSIDRSQSHVSCDFFHLIASVDPKNPPRGSIDFDEFELAYRNYSLLAPSNGGKLASQPEDSADDAATLTDGWRHGSKRMWQSAENPRTPQEFTFDFATTVTIQRVQIHQHPESPGKDIEVLASADGSTWNSFFIGQLPQDSPGGPNFTFLFKDGLDAAAKHVKVRLLSGYKPGHWGLGEIEMFGSGAVMQTDDDWYQVNQDIEALQPGQTYHYRLVALTAKGQTPGQNQTFTLPADARPQVTTETAGVTTTSAKITGRLNAMGQRTHFHFEYGLDANYGSKTDSQYAGLQITPRTASATLVNLKPGTRYHYRLVATNETATTHGPDSTFTTRQ